MLSIHFTLPQVLVYLRTIVARDPEAIARTKDGSVGCLYAEQEGHVLHAVCIIGQMFADLGLLRLLLTDPSDVRGYSDLHGTCSVHADFWPALAKFGITADEDAMEFMRSVQQKQDGGSTWGDALTSTVDESVSRGNAHLDDEQATLDYRREALANLFA